MQGNENTALHTKIIKKIYQVDFRWETSAKCGYIHPHYQIFP